MSFTARQYSLAEFHQHYLLESANSSYFATQARKLAPHFPYSIQTLFASTTSWSTSRRLLGYLEGANIHPRFQRRVKQESPKTFTPLNMMLAEYTGRLMPAPSADSAFRRLVSYDSHLLGRNITPDSSELAEIRAFLSSPSRETIKFESLVDPSSKPRNMASSPSPQILELSPIDDAQPCGYVRTLLLFQSHACSSEVLQSLQRGVRTMVSRWPHLRGRVIRRPEKAARGRCQVQFTDDDAVQVTRRLLSEHEFPLTYKQLSDTRVPISRLNEKLLCGVPEPAVPGPAAVVQANFIHGGGLILSICLHHGVVDGEGTRLVIEEFARGCNLGEPVSRACPLIKEVRFREAICPNRKHVAYKSWSETDPMHVGLKGHTRNFSESDSSKRSTPSSEDSELEVLERANLGDYHADAWAGPPNEKTNLLLTFSDTKLKALKACVVSALGHGEINDALVKRLSTNDCLAALLWNGITRARMPDLTSERSSFIMAVDGRTKMNPPIDPNYASAVVIHSLTSERVADIKGETTYSRIGTLAASIRRSIQDVDDEYIAQTVSFVNRFPEMQKFGLRKTSNDLLMTTWEKFAYQDMNFGPYLGHPEWARKPWSQQVADIVVLPKSQAGDDIEAVILLTNSQVRRLLLDQEFMSYVEHLSG